MNRARYAKVRASSARLAGFREIEGRSILLYAPQVWPRWVPGYAVDSSPITQWATNKGPQSIELDFSNRLMQRVPIAELRIRWGRDRAKGFRVLVSNDGESWKESGELSEEGGNTVVGFSPPVEAGSLRLELERSATGKGFSIRYIEVYGPAPELTPALPPVTALEAGTEGNDSIRLSWSAPSGGGIYLFKVYRGTEPGFEPGPENLVAGVDEPFHLDMGLEPDTKYYYRVSGENFSGREGEPSRAVSAKTGDRPLFTRMPIRGIIEGFYNDPWAHQERLKLIGFMEDVHLNYYIYAPKDEPYHRQLWRELYPPEEMENFSELVQACSAHRVIFNYAISPGLDMDYNDRNEIETLKRKLKSLFGVGVRAFTLALDDIPGSGKADRKMAADQVKVVNDINAWLKGLDTRTQLLFCPTVYSHTHSFWKEKKPIHAEYLEEIANIDMDVLIFWTGPGWVFSETIDLASAKDLQKVLKRPLIIWDNYPVNDVGLTRFIFLGPYIGRDLKLGEAVAGIFCNPMYLPNANRIPLYTVGRYYTAEDYDPWQAYEEALRFAGGEAAYPALKALADTLLNHPKFPDRGVETLPLSKAVEEFWNSRGTGSSEESEKKLRELFEAYARNPEDLEANLDDFQLLQELLPASRKLEIYGKAGIACLNYLNATDPAEKKRLATEIKSLQTEARKNSWHVADNNLGKVMSKLYQAKESQAVMDKFISRTLKKK